MRVTFNLYTILLLGTICLQCLAEPSEDKSALLDFINNIHHSHQLNWDVSLSLCSNWIGVTCNHDNSRVIALRLPGVGLNGPIPPNTISRLSAIQILSFRSNSISGSFPPDFVKLVNLTGLYLQSNSFSGKLPLDFSVWQNLSVINLSNNAFNGNIPSSISNLTHLTALNLASNNLVGGIPDLDIPSLQVLNLSSNQLNGSVPLSLLRFPLSAFNGNNVSYVNSSSPLSGPPIAAPPERQRKWGKFSESALLGIVLGGCLLGIAAIAILLIVFCKNKGGGSFSTKSNKGAEALKKGAPGTHSRNNKLVFFEGRNLAFDLEDLLRASAEVLGKGTFGTSYKAALEDANTVVVKRLKEGSVAKRDFEQQMEIVGNIRHVNVAALRAYYYSKEEKLMMYDYFPQGSVAALLHGNRGEGRIPLDWETRLKIAIGTARGIAHIHTGNGGKLIHGNIKSSNIFLNSQGYGCVGDLGLATLMTPTPAPISRIGFRAPEVTDTRRSTPASDVYSYGVLLLELLTGKSPSHPTGSDEVVHLVRWVQSVVREEWTAEVFDIELLKYSNIEEEMVEMLQIGMGCVTRVPEQRPKMEDVVKLVEDIRRQNTETRPSSANKSEISTPTPPPPVSDIGSSSATH